VTGAGRAASVASASGRERGQPARWRSGCHFPVISRLRTIFPDFGTRKFPVWAAAMRGCGYPKQLIQQCYSQGGQAIFALARFFCGNFPALTGNWESLSSDGLSPDQTAGGAPPLGLGRGECHARLFGRTAIAEQREAGGTAAAHPREQGAG